MKNFITKISFLLMFGWLSLNICYAQDMETLVQQYAMNTGEDATYLKDFIVRLDAAQPDSRPPVYRKTLALRKNITYRFSIFNTENSEGEAVLRVYDQSRLILSTWYPSSNKEYPSVTFMCKKSGAYTIVISFKEGKKGEAIGILSYVKKK